MRKSFTSILVITVVFLALGMVAAWAQPPDTLWTRTYGGSNYDIGNSGQETADGGLVAVGRLDLAQPSGSEIYLLKMDADGDTVWTRTYGGDGTHVANCVRQTADGGYIIAGYKNLGTSNDAYLIKTNASGDTAWTKTFGTVTGDDQFFSVTELLAGGYVASGHSSTDTTSYDVFLQRLAPTGLPLWSHTYGGSSVDIGRSVVQTSDLGFAIVGYTLSSGAGGMDMYFVKTGPTGLTTFDTTYGGTNWDYGYSLAKTEDGGYLLAGDTKSFGAGAGVSYDGWLVKINATGDTLWTSSFGSRSGDDIAYSVGDHPDGGYVLTGESLTAQNGKDLWVVKTDASGDSLWGSFYGGPTNDIGNSIFVTDDQGYFIVGQTQSFGAGSYDFYLIRLAGPPLPQILVEPMSLDFDTVLVNNSADAQFYITNTGAADLIIYGLSNILPEYTTDYDPDDSLIVPDDTLWITVTFAPTDSGVFMDLLTISNNDDELQVTMTGVGQQPDAVGDPAARTLPTSYALHSAVPNPFNPTTSIQFDLPEPGNVRLEVFDSSGRKAATLVDGWKPAGIHGATFDGSNLASGVYVCRLTAGSFEAAAKMVLMK